MSESPTPTPSRPGTPTEFHDTEVMSTNTDPEQLSIDADPDIPITLASSTDASGREKASSNDDEELARFRSEWKRDLSAQKTGKGDIGTDPAKANSLARFGNEWITDLLERKAGSHESATERTTKRRSAESYKPSTGGVEAVHTLPVERREQNIPRESGTVQAKPTGSPVVKRVEMPPDEDEEDHDVGHGRPSGRLLGSGAKPTAGSSHQAVPSKKPEVQSQRQVDRKDEAVSLYTRAVDSEQAGKLNEALMMYRKAFKLDDNVDRLYARSVTKAAAQAAQAATQLRSETPTSTDIVSSSAPVEEAYSFQRHIQIQPDYEKSQAPLHPVHPSTSTSASISTRPSPLTNLLQKLPIPIHETAFLPDDEKLPVPIALLPVELLDPILAHLDVASIERFGMTCWRARYVTANSKVWRRFAEGIYKAPSFLPEGLSAGDLVKRHRGEWRTTLVEEERVRMDGCYISVCHYIRPGAGDQWVTITHMITYHRFLRFYPDGSVISFLTTDHPSEVVPLLRPSLRAKGLHFGRWRLIRSDAPHDQENSKSPTDETSPKTNEKQARTRARIVITDLLEPGSETPRYEFEMMLGLRETGRGKWNKLDMLNYNTINLSTGESLDLSLKHQKPFYFSKVKSYHPQF